jgi:hypothetical protein
MPAHLQDFERYTRFPRRFGITIDAEGLRNRWDGGHCLLSESAQSFLCRAAYNVTLQVQLTVWRTLQQLCSACSGSTVYQCQQYASFLKPFLSVLCAHTAGY